MPHNSKSPPPRVYISEDFHFLEQIASLFIKAAILQILIICYTCVLYGGWGRK
jgi:hypothetical protein